MGNNAISLLGIPPSKMVTHEPEQRPTYDMRESSATMWLDYLVFV